ncbi:MAG: type II toxin-antitoxin system VapC family toxin [Stellaceae bacterium]
MIVADASAVLALLLGEAIHRLNPADLNGASISSVNLTEVLTRLCDLGIPGEAINASIAELNLRVISFDEMQARGAAGFRAASRKFGLSLGDRACLALAKELGCAAVTADRAWAAVDSDVEVIVIGSGSL